MPQRRRLHVLFPVLAVVTATAGAGAATRRTAAPTIVFVCEHGSAKSLLAASLFQQMAKERGVAARAISRGMAPDPSVPEVVVQALRGDGFDVSSFRPQALTRADVAASARLIAIGVDVGAVGARAGERAVHWDGVPPVSTNYAEARRDLLARIDRLLRELRTPAGARR